MKLFNPFKKRPDLMEASTWNSISKPEEIQTILKRSIERPQLIYKHSNQCSVSFIAKEDLDSDAEELSELADLYIVDVIRQREISNAIATLYKVRHESPQALLLDNGNVVWRGSHWDVKSEGILSNLTQKA